jgi:polygalacturonase
MKQLLLSILFLSIFFGQMEAQSAQEATHTYSVVSSGAKGDGQTNDTRAIQSAIDLAVANGGGTVLFPAGQYVSGSIVLKDYITLRFESGAILLGSLDLNDYPADLGVLSLSGEYVWKGPLVYAENARYIGIEGTGIVDGRGTRENFPPLPRSNQRPGLIRFKNCQFVTVKDVTLRNSACWTFHLRNCEDVAISGIRLNSNVNRNNDGIDVDGCSRVSITGCNINSEDDAIVLKSFQREKCRDFIISDCILTSTCSAIKIGTETAGDFENISISNCAIYGSRGINLFSVDGSNIDNVTISNISMRDVKSAIQLRLGARMRPYLMSKDRLPQVGTMKNIMISHVQSTIGHDRTSTGASNSYDFISGIPEHAIENVSLSDISISYFGNGTRKQAQREIPEEVKTYPKTGMFGDLPSYSFFVRHVKGIRMHNVRLNTLNPDGRPAVVFDNVSGISLSDCRMDGNNESPVVRLHNASDVTIRETYPQGKAGIFAGISGKASKDIILKDNFLKNVKNTFEQSKEVASGVVNEINTIR